jgi:hypothetical protein
MCDKTYIIDITIYNMYYLGNENLGAIYAYVWGREKWIGLSFNPIL